MNRILFDIAENVDRIKTLMTGFFLTGVASSPVDIIFYYYNMGFIAHIQDARHSISLSFNKFNENII